jgi:hypothetical protein
MPLVVWPSAPAEQSRPRSIGRNSTSNAAPDAPETARAGRRTLRRPAEKALLIGADAGNDRKVAPAPGDIYNGKVVT